MFKRSRRTRGKGRKISFSCYICKEKFKDPGHFDQHTNEVEPELHSYVLTAALTKRHDIHKTRKCYCRDHTDYNESYCRHCEWDEFLQKRRAVKGR